MQKVMAEILLGDVYDKDVNFLIGAGASQGLLPTLQLGIHGPNGKRLSFEELATQFENASDKRYIPLFMHYYASCIRPAQTLLLTTANETESGRNVVTNYRIFIETVLGMLQHRQPLQRKCNIFTTNYDGCIPLIADEILREGKSDFVINDGTRGFRERYLQASNFNNFLCQTGVFDRHQSSIPQLNLVHLHGSVYWTKTESAIKVDYAPASGPSLLEVEDDARLEPFSRVLWDPGSNLADLKDPGFADAKLHAFMAEYEKMPIVNPTKWKFHETVYEEHYYQMLRFLSYELEKPNAVLITFGFSFADEHILNLVKRSLSNPHLMVFICCFSAATHKELTAQFGVYKNVKCLALEEGALMNFSAFNQEVFTLHDYPKVEKNTDQAIVPDTSDISLQSF